jgi:two-component system sensor histidine kinase SenX3
LRHNLPPESLRFGSKPVGELVVRGNQEELRTAVFNLFDNAIKYSGDDKDIVVDVHTPNVDTILLSVRDHGIGIPRVELKRIFNRFYRGQNAATGQVKGTGLGLFIARAVARRYGGDAYAESAGEGFGSTFTIKLPRVHRT